MNGEAFNAGICKKTDDLPDHIRQEIVDLTALLMAHAFYSLETELKRDANIALAALQRALGLSIAKVFQKDKLPEIVKCVCEALIASVQEWELDGK